MLYAAEGTTARNNSRARCGQPGRSRLPEKTISKWVMPLSVGHYFDITLLYISQGTSVWREAHIFREAVTHREASVNACDDDDGDNHRGGKVFP